MKSPHLFCGNHGIIVKLYLLIGFEPTGQSARKDSVLLVQLTLCLPIVVQTHDAFPELFRVSRGFFGQLLSNSLSNPLRKVSRAVASGKRIQRWKPSFHSTKEGFKADQQRRHPCLFSIAHRCPRSPCRVKRLRAPASKRLCSSPKRASTPRPFRAIGGRRTAYKNILQKYRLLAILSG